MGKFNYYFVYIVSNWNNNVIYIGVTNDLRRRISEHKNKAFKGFTQKYNTLKLIYYETYQDVNSAIQREKELKKWRREKKNELIAKENPEWEEIMLE